MIKNQFIKNQLAKTFCHKCGASLENAKFVTVSEIPIALVGHATCPKCHTECMVTITSAGNSSMPVASDLSKSEIKSFLGAGYITYNELLDLHQLLEKETIWKLLQKHEKSLAKKINKSEKKKSSRQ